MGHLGLQRMVAGVAGKGQHRGAGIASITTTGIPYGVITQKNWLCRTVAGIVEIDHAIAGAVGHHVEIGELPHVASEAAHISDVHNRPITDFTLNTEAGDVSHGLRAVSQQDAADTDWGLEASLGQEGAIECGRGTTSTPGSPVKLLCTFDEWWISIQVAQDACPLPRIVVHSESASQSCLAIAEDVISKAEAGRSKDAFKINQPVRVSIDAGDNHPVRIRSISRRHEISNQDYRQSVPIRITCRVRNRVKGRLSQLRVLACSSITVGFGNCVVLKQLRRGCGIIQRLVQGGRNMLSRYLWQTSGKANAEIKRQARQYLPRVLHIPFQDWSNRGIVNSIERFGIGLKITQQSIGETISAVIRVVRACKIEASREGAAAGVELPVCRSLPLNASLELVRAPQLADSFSHCVAISMARGRIAHVILDIRRIADAERHSRQNC